MQRDLNLLRSLLLKIEASSTRVSDTALVEGISSDSQLARHQLYLAHQAGLIKGNILNTLQELYIKNIELTWEGHEFLDSIRDPEIWEKTKCEVTKIGSFSFDLVKNLAKGFIKKKIKDLTDIEVDV